MQIIKQKHITPVPSKLIDTNGTPSDTNTYNANAINELVKDVYSEEEQVIGTWIDDKLIYRKVINAGSITWNNNTKTIEVKLGSLDTLVNCDLWICYADSGNWYKNWDILGNITVNKDEISITANGFATFSKVIIILEYTKTTDEV